MHSVLLKHSLLEDVFANVFNLSIVNQQALADEAVTRMLSNTTNPTAIAVYMSNSPSLVKLFCDHGMTSYEPPGSHCPSAFGFEPGVWAGS